MKLVSSKNTWHFIFGVIFILIVGVVSYRLIFGKKATKTANQREQTQRETYITISPSPKTKNKYEEYFYSNSAPSPSPISDNQTSPNPTNSPPTIATKSGDVSIISENGATFLGRTTVNEPTSTFSSVSNSTLRKFTLTTIGFADNIPSLINALLSFVMVTVALLVFFQLILASFHWIASGGDKTKTESARNRIISAILGLLIVSASYAILLLALNFLGFDDLDSVFENMKNLKN